MSIESEAEREYMADRERWHRAAQLLTRASREAFGAGPLLSLVTDAAEHNFVIRAKRFIELAGMTLVMSAPTPSVVGRLWFDEAKPMLRSLRAHKAVRAAGPDYVVWFLKETWFEHADIEWSDRTYQRHAASGCACGLCDPGCAEIRLRQEMKRPDSAG